MHRSARNDTVAARILARVGGRATSLDTLKAVVDPFHDSEIDPQGWPDLTTSPSCVQIYKASMTISAPTNLPPSATWDCHIFNAPVLELNGQAQNTLPVNAALTYAFSGISTLGGAAIANIASAVTPLGLTAVSFNTASVPADFSAVTPSVIAPNVVAAQNLTIPNSLVQGASRVFAQGFEVHNTTAELYKGGSVLSYRMPLDDDVYHAQVTLVNGTQPPVSIEFVPTPAPPSTLSAALQLKGSRQWDAASGTYTVCGLHTQNIPCNGNTFLYPSYYNLLPFDVQGNQNTYQTLSTVIGTQTVSLAKSTFWSEFDTSGAWYTGLNVNSVLTINWNVYIERFPSPINQDLVLLAKQSPEYDVMGMELISAIMRTMPVATYVGDNSTGSWFTDILETGASYVAPLLSAMPHPVAKGIGAAITAGSTMMKGWNARPAAEREAINNQTKAAVRRMAGGGGTGAGARGTSGKKARKARTLNAQRKRQIKSARKGGISNYGPQQENMRDGVRVTPWSGKRASRRA